MLNLIVSKTILLIEKDVRASTSFSLLDSYGLIWLVRYNSTLEQNQTVQVFSMNTHQLMITLDREGEEPIYKQLIRNIKAQIESGVLPAGTRLPASRDLAKQLNISRISVVNAYAELRAEGFVSAHAGRGTFVSRESNQPENPAPITTVTENSSPDTSIRDLMRLSRKPGVISFSSGSPPTDFFPINSLREAMNYVLDRDGSDALKYEVPEGYGPLRAEVRDYVSALGIQCSSSNVLITGGTQQALDLVVQALVAEGETIVSENPTYIGMIDIARTRRINLHGLCTDHEGIRLDHLENYLIDNNPKLIYVMPTFQNPTGHVMPLHRRRQLINLANTYNVPILEDAVYHEIRFEGEHIPPLKALDDTGIVIHASGFTKMLLPGIRVGYIITDGQHYNRLVRVKQAADISTSGLHQRIIHYMLARGVLSGQLERNNRELMRRRDAAIAAAKQHFPPGTHLSIPDGGLVIWAELPHVGPTAAELYISAIQQGVAYAIGSVFYTNGGGAYRMRLNFGAHPPEVIDEGFRRLGRAWRELAVDYADMDKSPLL
ncbi:MAG: PLP-dependent aminotransferase family protein [Chloroflexi bacterium]|nr:MAG: PLP-dependent aminotransferase family protein [Chloroflexota bacterium]